MRSTSTDNTNILTIENLRTYFKLDEGTLKAVDGVDLAVQRQTTMGLIGESGCGKSVTARSILRIVPSPGWIAGGKITLFRKDGEPLNLTDLDPYGPAIRNVRGNEISMVFQEPMTSLSPIHTIGFQVTEPILLHTTLDKAAAKELALDMLDRVGISNPIQRFDEYPHHLSGGMRQRVMIATALSCNPALLIADEPTTALDVTVQAQILDLMQHLQAEFGMSILYITHDLGVIAEIADQVNVMYLGRVVEQAATNTLFKNPLHPYTQGLLQSIPKMEGQTPDRLDVIPGNVPTPIDMPAQCGFYSRCPHAIPGTCDTAIPALVEMEPGHRVRCFLHSQQEDSDQGISEEKVGKGRGLFRRW